MRNMFFSCLKFRVNFAFQEWQTLKSFTRWSTAIGCPVRQAARRLYTRSCWNAGERKRSSGQRSRRCSGDWKSSLRCRAASTPSRLRLFRSASSNRSSEQGTELIIIRDKSFRSLMTFIDTFVHLGRLAVDARSKCLHQSTLLCFSASDCFFL